MNRDELTAQKFIPDFLGMANNTSGRIYRTGDLGRINADGEVEYHGRIDTQVKIRGYRIETGEIESMLLELPEIAQAAVATHEPEPGMPELVAYYSFKQGAKLSRGEIAEALRGRLPAYMVPAFLEELPFIPMLISSKADHKKLPKPKGPRCQGGTNFVEAKSESERILARALAEVLKVERVSVEDHFFNDLGAHSLLMARFCARLRQVSGDVERFDARHLPEPDHRQAGGSSRRRGQRKHRRGQAGAGPRSLRPFLLRMRRASASVLCRLWPAAAAGRGHRSGLDLSRHPKPARPLSARHRRGRGHLRLPDRASDRRQMAAGRQMEARADSDLEPALFPLLGGQDADPHRAGGGLCRQPALQSLSARSRRQDRARRRHPFPLHAGRDRSVLGRRQHDPAQGLDPARLSRPRPTSSRSGRSTSAATPSSAKRACSTSTPRWAMAPSSAMPRRCRAGSACRTASVITARRRWRPRPTIARSRPWRAPRCGARSMRRCSSSASSGSRRRSPCWC